MANYFNDFFIGKVDSLRHNMNNSNAELSVELTEEFIMKNKDCRFNVKPIQLEEVKKNLISVKK